jgi:hypothetical protein
MNFKTVSIKDFCLPAGYNDEDCNEGTAISQSALHALLCTYAKVIYDLRDQQLEGQGRDVYQDRRVAVVHPRYFDRCVAYLQQKELGHEGKSFPKPPQRPRSYGTPENEDKPEEKLCDTLYGYQEDFNILVIPCRPLTDSNKERWVLLVNIDNYINFTIQTVGIASQDIAGRWHFRYFDPMDQPTNMPEKVQAVLHEAVSTARPIGHPVINIIGMGYNCVKPEFYNAMSDVFSSAGDLINKPIMNLDEDPWASGYHICRIVEHNILWTNRYSYMRQFDVTSELHL